VNQNSFGWLKAQEEIQRRIEEDLHLKRRRTRMRVARLKEASKNSSTKADARKATIFRPDALPDAPTRVITSLHEDPEADLSEGLKFQPVADGGLNFIAVYKRGYEDE